MATIYIGQIKLESSIILQLHGSQFLHTGFALPLGDSFPLPGVSTLSILHASFVSYQGTMENTLLKISPRSERVICRNFDADSPNEK